MCGVCGAAAGHQRIKLIRLLHWLQCWWCFKKDPWVIFLLERYAWALLLLARCCSLATVETIVRFASQIFFCYREEVNHFWALNYISIINIMTWCFKITVFSTCLLVHSAPLFDYQNQKCFCRSVVIEVRLKLLFVVLSCSLLSVVAFDLAELYIHASTAVDSVENVLSCVLNKILVLKLWSSPYLQVSCP